MMNEFLKRGDKIFQIIPETKNILKSKNSDILNKKDLLSWKHYANSYYFSGLILNKIFSNISNDKILENLEIDLNGLYNESDRLVAYSFLYRHYIELVLKLICLIDSSKSSPIALKSMNHDLKVTWKKAKNIILKLNLDISEDQIEILEKIIYDFIFIDNNSTRLRYPHDKKGNYVFNGNNFFGFLPAQSVKSMKRIKDFFDFILKHMFLNIR